MKTKTKVLIAVFALLVVVALAFSQTQVTGGSAPYTGADGVANNALQVAGPSGPLASADWLFNGSTWDRRFYCPNTSTFSVASATTQVVALSGTTKIRICSFSLNPSTITAGSVDIVTGTGTNCATGIATLTGAYTLPASAVVNAAMFSGGSQGPLTAPAGAAVCVRTATATVNGFITWAQY